MPRSALALAALLAVRASPALAAPDAAALAAAVDEEELRLTVEELTGVLPVDGAGGEVRLLSRDIHDPRIADAAEYVRGRFRDLGLDVSSHGFSCQGIDGLENVVAEIPGAGEGPPILLSAHYDSIGSLTEGGWDPLVDPAPGADDDASGVALLVEVARVLGDAALASPVRLVAFSCEEYGLAGSTAYASDLAGLGEELAGMVSFDPVGYNAWDASGEAPWLWASHDDRSAELAARWAELAAAGIPGYAPVAVHEDLIGGDARSDHHPFQERGYAAIHGGGFPQPPAYHTTSDTVDVVDFAYLAAFTRSAVLLAADRAGLVEPAADEAPDEAPGAGCACRSGPGAGAPPGLFSWLTGLAAVAAASGRRQGAAPRVRPGPPAGLPSSRPPEPARTPPPGSPRSRRSRWPG